MSKRNPLEDGNLSSIDNMNDEELCKAMGLDQPKPKQKKKLWVALTQSVLFIAFAFGLSCWYAFSIMVLWNWFLVPLGVMQIGFWNTMGLGCLIGMFTFSFAKMDREKTGKDLLTLWTMIIIYPAIALFFGWIFQMLMQKKNIIFFEKIFEKLL